jgi:hypothetical protein
LPRRGPWQLIIKAHHKTGQLIIVGAALEARRLDIAQARRAAGISWGSRNNGGWVATGGRWQSQTRSRVTIAVIITVTSARQTEDDLVAVAVRRGQPRHPRSGQRQRRRWSTLVATQALDDQQVSAAPDATATYDRLPDSSFSNIEQVSSAWGNVQPPDPEERTPNAKTGFMYVVAFFFVAQMVLLVLSVLDTKSGTVRPVDLDPVALWSAVIIVLAIYALFPSSSFVQNWIAPIGFLALGILFLDYTGSGDAAPVFVACTLLLFGLLVFLMRFARIVGVVVVVLSALLAFWGLSGPPQAH